MSDNHRWNLYENMFLGDFKSYLHNVSFDDITEVPCVQSTVSSTHDDKFEVFPLQQVNNFLRSLGQRACCVVKFCLYGDTAYVVPFSIPVRCKDNPDAFEMIAAIVGQLSGHLWTCSLQRVILDLTDNELEVITHNYTYFEEEV